MSIGLMDADMTKYTFVPFNIDIMKLSTYYKRKREIVGLTPFFAPYKYTKLIYRKDYDDGVFSKYLFDYNNIEYGGLAFSGGRYVPMAEEIEKCIPDTSIYEAFRSDFSTYKSFGSLFTTMMGSPHVRLSLDGQNVWKDFTKSLSIRDGSKVLFVHDNNLNKIKDAKIIIPELLSFNRNKPRSLAIKFPLKIDNEQDFFDWTQWAGAGNFFPIHFLGSFSDEGAYKLTTMPTRKSICSQLQYFVTADCSSEQDFVSRKLPDLFRQLSFLRRNRIKILLKIDEDFFEDNMWYRVLLLIARYFHSLDSFKKEKFDELIEGDSLFRFAKYIPQEKKRVNEDYFDKREIRKLFFFVQEQNPELFELFYNSSNIIYKGGRLVYE